MVSMQGMVLALLVSAGCFTADLPSPDYSRLEALAYGTSYPYPRLVVEIDYAPDREPHPEALAALRATLDEVVDKREIEMSPPTQIRAAVPYVGDTNWRGRTHEAHASTFDAMSASNITYGAGDTAYLHVLYLNGGVRTENGSVLGLHTPGAIFVFVDDIRPKSPALLPPVRDEQARVAFEVERAVLLHELGHALGLVDSGAPMLRPHGDGQGHSTNPKSVMHGELESSGALSRAEIPHRFDADDLADLRALQAEARALLQQA